MVNLCSWDCPANLGWFFLCLCVSLNPMTEVAYMYNTFWPICICLNVCGVTCASKNTNQCSVKMNKWFSRGGQRRTLTQHSDFCTFLLWWISKQSVCTSAFDSNIQGQNGHRTQTLRSQTNQSPGVHSSTTVADNHVTGLPRPPCVGLEKYTVIRMWLFQLTDELEVHYDAHFLTV